MNFNQLSQDTFLERNRIKEVDFVKADICFDELVLIAKDYTSNIPSLHEAAELLARILQRCEHVHSVRWRVKDPEHLMEKIVRKRIAKSKKYSDINSTNYMEKVTDLVGVRVLHLFKYEWENIHQYILKSWEPCETPIAYIRKGDEGNIVESYKKNNCEVHDHDAGYRSIHYVISTQPTLKKVLSEIQVRTIFEEGWSEIDHKIRYPNFSNNQLLAYFLTIFNRMAGSADEMGSFVRSLTEEISRKEQIITEKSREQEEHLSKIEVLVSELEGERKQNKSKDNKLNELNEEIRKLRSSSSLLGGPLSGFYEPPRLYESLGGLDNLYTLSSTVQNALDTSALGFSSKIQDALKIPTPNTSDITIKPIKKTLKDKNTEEDGSAENEE